MKKFEELYLLYKNDIYYFLYQLTSHNADVSEELMQETFYQAILSFGRFRGECEIKTWLCQIAKNTYYRYVRSEVKEKNTKNKIMYEVPEFNITKEMEQREEILNLRKSIDNLDEKSKTIVQYRLYSDMKFGEIAKILNMKETTAKVIFSRAKVKIQNQLKEGAIYEI